MRTSSILFFLLTAYPALAVGQERHWQLVAEVGMTNFSAAFTDTTSPPLEFEAWRPKMYTLRLLHEGGKLGWGVGVSLASVGIGAGEGTGLVVVFEDQYTLVEIAPELRYQLLSTSAGARLVAHAGPVFDKWIAEGTSEPSLWGAQGGATLAIPITSRLGADLRTDWTYTGSFVSAEEVGSDGIRKDSMWRGRFGVGLALKL